MRSLALLTTVIASVSAHGYVQGIVAGGTHYSGYNPSFQWRNPVPIVAGWSAPEDIDNGFIDPTKFSDPNIICHRSATPAGIAVKISAGDVVELQWTVWPESHHGPILDYIAKCPGESCDDVDKTDLKFVKIGEKGMVNWDAMPGKWASDELIVNNNSWSIKIPASLTPGSYVLRHEIISLHSANNANGAQNYPQCINLDITESSGSEDFSDGIPATQFYTADDPGIAVNIYESQSTYQIPGPTLWSGAAMGAKGAEQTSVKSASSVALDITSTEAYARPTAYTASTSPSPSSSPSSSSADDGGGEDDEEKPEGSQVTHFPSTVTSTTFTTVAATTTTTNHHQQQQQSGEPSPYSKIQALINALPSGALTKTISPPPSPSSSPSSSSRGQWGEVPAKDLPEGWTLRDLLGWVRWGMKKAWGEGDGVGNGNGGQEKEKKEKKTSSRDGEGKKEWKKKEGRHSRDWIFGRGGGGRD